MKLLTKATEANKQSPIQSVVIYQPKEHLPFWMFVFHLADSGQTTITVECDELEPAVNELVDILQLESC